MSAIAKTGHISRLGMIYVLQVAVLIFGIAAERYVSKWANQKIADEAPYTSGVFVTRPLTGEKAIFMYKTNIIVTRVVLVLLVISIIIINTITCVPKASVC